jgi:hypothetical protein
MKDKQKTGGNNIMRRFMTFYSSYIITASRDDLLGYKIYGIHEEERIVSNTKKDINKLYINNVK